MSFENANLEEVADNAEKQTKRRLIDQAFSEKVKQQLEKAEVGLEEHGPAEVDPDYIAPSDLEDTVVEKPGKKE